MISLLLNLTIISGIFMWTKR